MLPTGVAAGVIADADVHALAGHALAVHHKEQIVTGYEQAGQRRHGHTDDAVVGASNARLTR